jgi:hypothetical protein
VAHEAAVVLGTLGGALLDHRLTLRQFREQERRAFVGRQISDLYSPLMGLLQQA